jgi:alpha-glucuronidase
VTGRADEDGYDLWLRYRPPVDLRSGDQAVPASALASVVVEAGCPATEVIVEEVTRAAAGLFGIEVARLQTPPGDSAALIVGPRTFVADHGVPLDDLGDLRGADDGHAIVVDHGAPATRLAVVGESPAARVRGVFELLRRVQLGYPIEALATVSVPVIEHRVLAHWDNLDGSIERGYAGRSLWQWAELPEERHPRYRDYARACASLGLNGACLNNVNSVGAVMSDTMLVKVAAIADELRPYGIRVWLAPSWASPMTDGGLATADPAEADVARYWQDRVERIYQLIPDFAGFQIKADSEGQPGPFQYGADHATGANLLARALHPHGGVVLWRAFVYDVDVDPDRAKCAFVEYTPLDGTFDPNVIVQAKNGPVDFQPREPFSPLFGGMAATPVALELQVTQEYLGHSTHLVYLGPMWSEILGSDTHSAPERRTVADVVGRAPGDSTPSAIVGVANTGSDRNWCGHHFGQANWYAFGRLAWDPELDPMDIAEEWVRLTWTTEPDAVASIVELLRVSWPACVDYMVPLGLHHLSEDGFHYGPEPDLDQAPRIDWTNTYFHRADDTGLGFDRSSSGSNAVAQYHEPLRSIFDDPARCPEDLLLWFHHLNWDHRLRSGRTLLEELAWRYARGAAAVEAMAATWADLADVVDRRRHREVADRLARHVVDSADWAATCRRYFESVARGQRGGRSAG